MCSTTRQQGTNRPAAKHKVIGSLGCVCVFGVSYDCVRAWAVCLLCGQTFECADKRQTGSGQGSRQLLVYQLKINTFQTN